MRPIPYALYVFYRIYMNDGTSRVTSLVMDMLWYVSHQSWTLRSLIWTIIYVSPCCQRNIRGAVDRLWALDGFTSQSMCGYIVWLRTVNRGALDLYLCYHSCKLSTNYVILLCRGNNSQAYPYSILE